jgi:hypothetical protein
MQGLVIYGGLTLVCLFGLVTTIRGVAFPEKMPWMIGMGLTTSYVMAATLYELGGKYTVLVGVFFPMRAAVQTTGALAFAVGTYSRIHGADKISAQWFAVPTGSAPLAMLYQYVPPPTMQAVFMVVALAYALKNKSPMAAPCGAILAGAAVAHLELAVPGVLEPDQLAFALYSAAVLVTSAVVTDSSFKFKGM